MKQQARESGGSTGVIPSVQMLADWGIGNGTWYAVNIPAAAPVGPVTPSVPAVAASACTGVVQFATAGSLNLTAMRCMLTPLAPHSGLTEFVGDPTSSVLQLVGNFVPITLAAPDGK